MSMWGISWARTLKDDPAGGFIVRMSRLGGGWNGCRMDMQPTVDSSCSMMAAPFPNDPPPGPFATKVLPGSASCDRHHRQCHLAGETDRLA